MSAMDVIVTKDTEGYFWSTPFYVLFAAPIVFRRNACVEQVAVEVNGAAIPAIQMFKDLNGEVYFVDEENAGAGANNNQKMPTHECLKLMNLKKGENTIKFFAVATGQYVSAKIFMWDTNAKIVVTDVDGTITRSDMRGHLYSRFGVKWHHNAVSDCFAKVNGLGYKIVYITARSMTMEAVTRKYIYELGLPAGPLLLSPKSLMGAVTSELITRDAKFGKIEHLTNIVKLFPNCANPIVAGFGNNENDEWAYRSSGIPHSHIFIVNKKSEILVSSGRTSYEVVATEICKFFHELVHELEKNEEAGC